MTRPVVVVAGLVVLAAVLIVFAAIAMPAGTASRPGAPVAAPTPLATSSPTSSSAALEYKVAAAQSSRISAYPLLSDAEMQDAQLHVTTTKRYGFPQGLGVILTYRGEAAIAPGTKVQAINILNPDNERKLQLAGPSGINLALPTPFWRVRVLDGPATGLEGWMCIEWLDLQTVPKR